MKTFCSETGINITRIDAITGDRKAKMPIISPLVVKFNEITIKTKDTNNMYIRKNIPVRMPFRLPAIKLIKTTNAR